MKIGDWEINAWVAAMFRLDGGAMFGVVPRSLWSRVAPPDDENRISMAMRTLVVRGHDQTIVVDAGAGTGYGEKLEKIYGFDSIFTRQVEALAKEGDVVLGISTSGNSENVVRALECANKLGAVTIALLGKDGGQAKDHASLAIVVPSDYTARIQEVHITIGHIICELIEEGL